MCYVLTYTPAMPFHLRCVLWGVSCFLLFKVLHKTSTDLFFSFFIVSCLEGLFLRYILIWKADLHRERERNHSSLCWFTRGREREIPLQVHSPNGRNGWGWTRSKPEARSFFQFSPHENRTQGLEPTSIAFPGTLIGNWTKSGSYQEPPRWPGCGFSDPEFKSRTCHVLAEWSWANS